MIITTRMRSRTDAFRVGIEAEIRLGDLELGWVGWDYTGALLGGAGIISFEPPHSRAVSCLTMRVT
jgi:hypothetical protein